MPNKKLKLQELNRISVSQFKEAAKTPILIILDNIRSFNNVGSVFRTADAFRVEKIFLCGITPQPPHRDIHKTALGATETVDWAFAVDTLELVRDLRSSGIKTYAVEQTTDAIMLNAFQPDKGKKLALIFGNEVDGVQQEVIDNCDGVIEIPQAGTKHSLNISVCNGIVVWDIYSKMQRSV
jgi:23S rRNA (guanosine2251-2'-O)-methyltransferase